MWKGNQTFRHDLFKLDLQPLKKNVSFTKGTVKIETYEHSHFFHTFDSNGRPQTHSTPQGGHFHKIEWKEDKETGKLVAKCGPPMHHIYVRKDAQQHKKMVPVQWETNQMSDEEMDVSTVVIKDDHVHNVEYLWSEEISADTVKRRKDIQEEVVKAQVNGNG